MKNNNINEYSYNIFLCNICKDIFLFIFFVFVFLLYKIIFLFSFRAELADASFLEIVKSLFFGIKFSLKTVGFLAFTSFIFSSAVQQFFHKYPADKIRFIIGSIFLFIISLLLQIRIPYYAEFHVSFSPFMFNTFKYDVFAILKTIIVQYGLFWRIGVIIFSTLILMFLLKHWLKMSSHLFNFLMKFNPKAVIIILLPILIFSVLFIRFDGNFSFVIFSNEWKKDTIDIKQHLLKEVLFDEIEAIIAAYEMYSESKSISYNITLEEVKNSLVLLLSKEYKEESLLPFLSHTAKGSTIKKPRHIFLIVGENYALWPLLPKYNNLPLAKNMRRILEKYDNIVIKNFLSASGGTIDSMASIITGLPSLKLNQMLFMNKSSEIGLFQQIKKLGYRTRFFYGGYPSWGAIGSLMRNQGIEESYYNSSFSGELSTWGIDDKSLFKGILNEIDESPTFNLILTTSHHSPYPVDMSKEPDITSKEEMGKFINKNVANKELLIKKMQHFEYMDLAICNFIESVLEKYPDTLFIITGDHAQRWNIESNPLMVEKLNVPLILIGKGLKQSDIKRDLIGSHSDIVATILELISPKGTNYFSLGKDILHEQNIGISDYYWMNNKIIISNQTKDRELFDSKDFVTPEELETDKNKIEAHRAIAAWVVLYGLELK